MDAISAFSNFALALIGGLGAWYAWSEYQSNKELQKRELAWRLLARLREEEPLRLCTIFLDWSERKVEVPERYLKVYEQPPQPNAFSDSHQTFHHTLERMKLALSKPSKTSGALRFSWPEVIYRDLLDQFFDYLKEVQAAVDDGWLEASDLRPLHYWVNLLRSNRRMVIEDFRKQYHKDLDLDSLAEKLGASLPPSQTERLKSVAPSG